MPLKTLVGSNVPTLLKQAQAAIGPDAVILHVRRIRTPAGEEFEVAAADPATALRAPVVSTSVSPAQELIAPPSPRSGALVIALVGPTGGGKTTTLAKLANHPRVFGPRRVGLLGLDTYRIGALEQLRTYAELAGLPFAVAYSADDLPTARAKLPGCEVILVDTAGRSPKNRLDRDFTDDLLRQLGPHEVHLTIPAATPVPIARRLLREARLPAPTHLLVTKLDEAPDEAGVFELAVDLSLPIRWVTDGQEVPFDLASASEQMTAIRLGRHHRESGLVALGVGP